MIIRHSKVFQCNYIIDNTAVCLQEQTPTLKEIKNVLYFIFSAIGSDVKVTDVYIEKDETMKFLMAYNTRKL